MSCKQVIACCALLGFASAASALTVEELLAKQRELQIAETQAKIDKAREASRSADTRIIPVPPPTPAVTAATSVKSVVSEEDIRLVAVYGMRDKLFADLTINGSLVSLRQGQTIGSWKLHEISKSKAILIKINRKEQKELYITPPISDTGGIGGGVPSAMPPIPSGFPPRH